MELVLPVPKDASVRAQIADETKHIVETRADLRQKAHDVSLPLRVTVEWLSPALRDEDYPSSLHYVK